MRRTIAVLVWAALGGGLSANCLAQKRASQEEAEKLAGAKYRVTVTLGDVRQECAGPRAMEVNDRVSKGRSREEAESSIEGNFATLLSNSMVDNWTVLKRNANRVSDPMSNFIVCVTKTRYLQTDTRIQATPQRGAPLPAHIKTAGSAPTGGGEYSRISQTQWLLLRTEDISQYEEYYADLVGFAYDKPGTAAASKPAGVSGAGAAGAPRAGLSQQQISACSEEIKRTQIDSQKWTGNVNDVAARLGRIQKGLFEGRCAGHPEAQAYIASANKMLGYGGNATGGGRGAPLPASAAGAGGSGSPDANRSRKIHNPAADAKSCVELIRIHDRDGPGDTTGRLVFANKCPTAVEVFWCSKSECARDTGNTWTIGVGRSWPMSSGEYLWGACRGANSGGFDRGSYGQKYTCPNLTW